MIKKIDRIGISSDLSEEISYKIIISNQLWLVLLFFNIAVSILFLLFAPKLLIISAVMLVASLAGWLLNYAGFSEISRFLASIIPFTIAEIASAAISQSPSNLYIGNGFIAFSFLVIPFIIYDLDEKIKLLFSFSYCIIVFFMFPLLNDWIDISINNKEYGNYQNLVALIAILILVACLYALQYINILTKEKNQNLLLQMEDTNAEVEKARLNLEKTLEEVEKTKKEDELRTWASEGLSQFTVLMRSHQDIEQQYYNILSWLIQYLKLNQGALYVVNDDNKNDIHILQAATYAFEKRKYLEKRIEIGEGLIGACYLEKKKIILNKVPENYIHITSGLGEARPKFVIIIPLIVNEEVTGIIEFADFRQLQNFEINFIEKISEPVGVLIRDYKIKNQTQKLMEESLIQSETMKTQEEEMRQNLEELMATQEESERKYKEMQKIIESLKDEIQTLS